MIYTSSQRYLTPKWQARVVPTSAAFKFSNGVTVHNIWELKQALSIIREDIINQYLGKNNNIAKWVREVVGDTYLADQLNESESRWQMIVSIERVMMQTLSLPEYVAARWLQKAQWPFIFLDGNKASSLEDMEKILHKIDDETVAFHLQRDPNDISKWINDIIGDYMLSDILQEAENRQQMITFMQDHIKMLHNTLSCK